MTAERAQAYGRVMALLDDATELEAPERDLLRGAADTLLFAPGPDTDTREAIAEARALAHSLVDSGRCSAETAGSLLAALRACGPEGLPASMMSPGDARFGRHPFWSRVGR